MYTEKIQKLENEILELKKYIKANKKEIKKREKILSIAVDEELEMEIQIYKEEIEKFTNELKTRKELIKKIEEPMLDFNTYTNIVNSL